MKSIKKRTIDVYQSNSIDMINHCLDNCDDIEKVYANISIERLFTLPLLYNLAGIIWVEQKFKIEISVKFYFP